MNIKQIEKELMRMKQTGKTTSIIKDISINVTKVTPPNICVEMWGKGLCSCN